MVRIVLKLCYLSDSRTTGRNGESFHETVSARTLIREQVGIFIDLLQLVLSVVIGFVFDLRYLGDGFTVR